MRGPFTAFASDCHERIVSSFPSGRPMPNPAARRNPYNTS
ncbi:hypothetical protein Lokhon_02978 [Limimaricola hongkongensis DSM 17492]|uniref:Uncharacterized protein n=1 Tax=Limimaricola hongkongensis DSM 17492 TaxID=1122180 RepID=A0A017HAI5_9RHOB|nr:hypothetical protein Lokhon_02978 [Limimaricola hongkongensis DSM 17492]